MVEEAMDKKIRNLEDRIRQLEDENVRLKGKLETLGETPKTSKKRPRQEEDAAQKSAFKVSRKLDPADIERYSRQLLLSDGFGVEGQLKLLNSSVLVIGAGGIGSSVLLYLAGSGVGKITVVDFDQVETSNLHRQVMHKTSHKGMNKAQSAKIAVNELNPRVKCHVVTEPITHENALDLVSRHSCVVDASDNPQTRYIVNDACVLAGKPLVSGSAIGTEGQLTVYNLNGGPCYRCLYPKPSPIEGAKTCSDNGVLGPVPGLIGVLQATETLKVLTRVGETMSNRLLMYDAMHCSFLPIKTPKARTDCVVCGKDPTIRSMEDSRNLTFGARGPSCDYAPPDIDDQLQITCAELNEWQERKKPFVLLDVRAKEQYDLCSLEGSVNLPLQSIRNEADKLQELSAGEKPIFCICRRGIFSVSATKTIQEMKRSSSLIHSVRDVKGGLEAWRKNVDSSFPSY